MLSMTNRLDLVDYNYYLLFIFQMFIRNKLRRNLNAELFYKIKLCNDFS